VLPTVAAATQVVSPRARLEADLAALVAANHVSAGIAVIDLSGPDAATWSLNGTARFDAASTYKLPVLMYNAEQVAARKYSPSDSICMKEGEDEGDSWFRDYEVGKCFTRQVLATRVGRFSDNTGARMLADNMGGAARLNTYARSRGAAGSAFYSGNTTDAMDLANLWSAEVRGTAGGKPAQDWLYPLLEKTATELGIPAGVPRTTTVAHKTGWIDTYVLDAGVVFGGPRGDYVLAVAEKGKSSSAGGWAFVKAVSARVWAYQQER
jgi:beta-lactamase class A